MDAVIEPTTLELQPCDQPNIAEATVPQQQSSPLDASIPHESPLTDESQVNLEPPLRILPNRITRGIPRVSYEPVRTSTPKYPLNNYVSYHRLSKACESFANQLSTVHVPNSVQEAIKDPRWKNAMNEEMKSLQRNATWEVIDLPAGKNLWDVDGFFQSNTKLMVILRGLKHDLWSRDTVKHTGLIIQKLLHQWLK
jgi:hypothetical protein